MEKKRKPLTEKQKKALEQGREIRRQKIKKSKDQKPIIITENPSPVTFD